jgi:YidC/Oxa1 family membrane protein insertase
MRSQMKNMEIQPKLKEIQAKYKNEPEKLQKEMLRLYKEEGFNPMGGCLPMLIPLPILITLFFVFQSTIAFRGVEFLWLPDLSAPTRSTSCPCCSASACSSCSGSACAP